MTIYKIVCCPKCHKFAITTAGVSFSCIHCRKTSDLSKMKIFFTTDSPEVARKVLQKINAQKGGYEEFDGFISAG
ncbi:MAG: DUF5817 domain-containing protein [Nanoarchaeota archaeon]